MDSLSYKTISATPATIEKKWVVIDATDQVLGRLCSKIAKILRGKNKADYTPNLDCGDNVIVINADKVILNGDKMNKREYLRYTGYPGGQRSYTPGDLMEKSYKVTMKGKHPLFIKVVKGMLPKTKLGAKQLTNLHVFNGAEHPFGDKNPIVMDINKMK
ncbi:MAG: 50S ribosomal protein L13 [Bacteroides sp.]|nr:50S ribosomal protein L13 [Bacteroidales bacterium]MBD5222488.1 50S ribosomal protein L13 [Bacteroidales bacterium]MBD5305832.1 50S ribosomal protein L13 [Bacteroides sp.]MBD5348890.1 50S ribosomal protein L13 [Bacteroides sp.]